MDNFLKLDAVLIYDAVMMYTEAVTKILSKEIEAEVDYSVPCDSQEAWPHGYSIINSMKLVKHLIYSDLRICPDENGGVRTKVRENNLWCRKCVRRTIFWNAEVMFATRPLCHCDL